MVRGIDISVVVPFYNAERYISACIKALLSQSYPRYRYEIIMVDNNSTDGSPEIVKLYPSIKLLSETKQGAYAARNTGVSHSKGEIIAFTDPDCIPSPSWLERISTVMASPEIKGVIGYRQPASDSPFLAKIWAFETAKENYIFSGEAKELYYGHNNNMAIKKDIFDKLGPFIERKRGSDVVFIRRVVEEYDCCSIAYCPDIIVRHMEIDSLLKHFYKMFIYGKSRQKFKNIIYCRSLNSAEKIKIFQAVTINQKHKPIKSMTLFLLLAIGTLCWNLGGLASHLAPQKESIRPHPSA